MRCSKTGHQLILNCNRLQPFDYGIQGLANGSSKEKILNLSFRVEYLLCGCTAFVSNLPSFCRPFDHINFYYVIQPAQERLSYRNYSLIENYLRLLAHALCSSSIIETLKAKLVEKTTEGLAYFYCDYKDAATQQAANIVKSMVKHAAIQNDRSCEDLQLFLEKYKRDRTLDSTPSISNMTDVMLKMVGHYDCFYIVVDALDECPDDYRLEVLDILKTIRTKASNARVIYTSREETDIKEAFSDFKSLCIAANMSDLKLYVVSQIETRTSSGRLKIKHSEVKEKIINKLTHEADGM